MGKYEENFINRSTLFLLSSFETERKTKVVTKHGEFFSRLPALQLLDHACMLYASTYDGRVKATRHNLKQHNVSVELDVSIHTMEKQRSRMYEMLYYYMKIGDRHNT